MKTITGESFEVRTEEGRNVVFFKGALRLSGSEDYAPILEMLKGTLSEPVATVLVDLRDLDFLNSSGITMLSVLWEHGPTMLSRMKEKQVQWPRFETREMSDLIAYLNVRDSRDAR